MKILALDIGKKSTGVASSDELLMFAHPRKNLTGDHDQQFIQLLELLKSENHNLIVVGLPLELDGRSGAKAKEIIAEAGKLQSKLRLQGIDIPFDFIDERLTTKEAEIILSNSRSGKSKLKDREKSKKLDTLSAVLILESYMSSISK